MPEVALPDCTDYELQLTLTPEEEERLLQEIAEKGKEGLDEFAKRYSARLSSGSMREKLEQYRRRLEKQASRILEQKRKELETGEKENERKIFREIEDIRRRQDAIITDMENVSPLNLEDLMERDDLLRLIKEQGPETLWERLRALFLRFYLLLLGLWVRIRAFFRRKKTTGTERKGRKRRTLAIFGGKMKFNLGVSVSELLQRPEIRRELKRELESAGGVSGKGFEEKAENLLRRHMEAAARQELEREQEKSEEERRRLEDEEARLQRELEEEKEREHRHQAEALERLKEELRKKTDDPVKRMLERNLIELGFIQEEGEEIVPTTALLERFAELLFQRELSAIPSTGSRVGRSEHKLGIYERAKMRTVYEESRMDIVSSLVNSRLNHPGDSHIYDDDIMVYREESAVSSHVVIMFDMSSSMEENHRIDAAKRTVLALYRAVKRQREKDRIDIIGFETHVSLMDLMSVWNARPRGFTNIAGALRTARLLFEESGADVKIAYLITDGLPEAYTDERGRDAAGEPEVAMRYALREAKEINAHLTMILLEPEEEAFVEAGKRIVEECRGRLIITSPDELMHEVLADYLS